MLSEMDDYLIHQTADTFDHAYTSDPRFQDRNYFNVHPRENLSTILTMGLGNFPNTNVMDGYVILMHNDMQYNLRLSRDLKHDRQRLEAGPFKMSVVRPFEEWQLSLQDGDHGFSFDITFNARTLPYEHRTPIYIRAAGAEVWHQIHVQQSCSYAGWLKAGDERMSVDGWWGSRDRSWGVRGPIRGTPSWGGWGGSAWQYLWMSAQFDDCAVHTWSTKLPNGDPIHTGGCVAYTDGRFSAPFVSWHEEVVVPPGGEIPDKAISTFVDSEGKKVSLSAQRMTELFWEGLPMRDGQGVGIHRGELHIEHERWTPDEVAARFPKPPRFGDSLCVFNWDGRKGSGVYESRVL